MVRTKGLPVVSRDQENPGYTNTVLLVLSERGWWRLVNYTKHHSSVKWGRWLRTNDRGKTMKEDWTWDVEHISYLKHEVEESNGNIQQVRQQLCRERNRVKVMVSRHSSINNKVLLSEIIKFSMESQMEDENLCLECGLGFNTTMWEIKYGEIREGVGCRIKMICN